ncbi:hypothetical protein AHAS_Ahas19G0191900 [Arachis hypogaea]
MTIAEYTSKFEELCRSSRISQGTPESYEGWKCVKYEVGLRKDIMCVVAPLEIRRFSELVDKAMIVEDYANEAILERDVRGGTSGKVRGTYVPSRGRNFKMGRRAPQRLQGQGHIEKTNHDKYHRARGAGKQAWVQQEELKCQRCGNTTRKCRAWLGSVDVTVVDCQGISLYVVPTGRARMRTSLSVGIEDLQFEVTIKLLTEF